MLCNVALLGFALTSGVIQTRPAPNATWIGADDHRLQYYGRVGHEDPKAANFYYSATGFHARFTGTSLALRFQEDGYGPANSFGVRIDGSPEIPVQLIAQSDQSYIVAVGLTDKVHDLDVYRRQDTYGGVSTFKGLWLDKIGGGLEAPPKLPTRKIEFFGDSVMGGTASVAFGYEARPDGDIDYANPQGFVNDGYWSFGAIAARKLHAQANVQGIGGLALLDHTGWFGGALDSTVGLQTTWDKLDPLPGQMTPWDFSQFTPDVVVLSIGQNDQRGGHLQDAAWKANWEAEYLKVLEGLHGHYPNAPFVLTTTLLFHDPAFDAALREVAATYSQTHGAGTATYFGFKRVGKGTPGHPRLAEEEEMGSELAAYLELRPGLWKHSKKKA